jgi:mannose-6-phosphate isomerase-like protein (cupin superfamily)
MSSAKSNGSRRPRHHENYEAFPQHGPEGSDPLPHSHDWDESFFVIDGSVEIIYGGTMSVATAGSFVHIPAGTVHSFRCGSGGVEMLSMTSHTSQASDLFATIDREVTAMPPDVSKMFEIGIRYGARFDAWRLHQRERAVIDERLLKPLAVQWNLHVRAGHAADLIPL